MNRQEPHSERPQVSLEVQPLSCDQQRAVVLSMGVAHLWCYIHLTLLPGKLQLLKSVLFWNLSPGEWPGETESGLKLTPEVTKKFTNPSEEKDGLQKIKK